MGGGFEKLNGTLQVGGTDQAIAIGLSQQVLRRPIVVEPQGFLAHLVPLGNLAVAAPEPRQGDQIDLFIFLAAVAAGSCIVVVVCVMFAPQVRNAGPLSVGRPASRALRARFVNSWLMTPSGRSRSAWDASACSRIAPDRRVRRAKSSGDSGVSMIRLLQPAPAPTQ